MNGPKVTFFMLVTNRDALIANYCVKSYQSIQDNFKYDIPFVLYIYCNCLDDATTQKYVPEWSRFDYVEIFDNHEKMSLAILYRPSLIDATQKDFLSLISRDALILQGNS